MNSISKFPRESGSFTASVDRGSRGHFGVKAQDLIKSESVNVFLMLKNLQTPKMIVLCLIFEKMQIPRLPP
jgi:hypothetical protein